MRKNQTDLSQNTQRFSRKGKGFRTALCAAAAATATGILTSWLMDRKEKEALPEKPSEETDAARLLGNLLLAISHDLRTPLSGIMGNSLLYLENHETLNEEEKLELVTHIHEDSGWLINIVENLLAMTHIQNTENSVNTREEILEEVLGEALQKMEMRHPGFEIRAVVPEEIIILPMDALLIEQVIINLLENALLHSESKKPVEVIVEDGKDSVTFTVRDYGRGVPEEVLTHLFDSASLAKAASDPHKKTSIGLIICKAIISAHHGSLTARNHSLGAEFIFTLPKRSC